MSEDELVSGPPAPSRVRPYTLTSGRTDTGVDLPIEASIRTTNPGADIGLPAHDLRSRIMVMCESGPSVAEISARLSVPLGVARVLVGDLIAGGHLRVLRTLGDRTSNSERRELIGRTLSGLRAL